MSTHTDITRADPTLVDGFRQFARNGRCGTCGECPHDSEGHAYPEFCVHTGRYDHHLAGKELVERYESASRDIDGR